MSQICPSSSHQLVAAAIAFRRARRKFPKNYGLCCNSEEVTKFDETESITGNEETNDAENLSFTPRKCLNTMSNCVEPVAVWNDESGESSSFKENLLQIPIICSCCRKRNEQGSGGDALDIVPSKEHNGIARKIECFKAEQSESNDGKAMKGFITESRNSSRCRTSYSHSGRRSPKETSSKLDSVNLLYDRGHDDVDKGNNSSEKRNCNAGEHSCSGGRRDCKSAHRNSRSKLNVSESRKDNVLPNVSHDCDFHCAKHSTMNLLGSHTDCCQSQNSHRCYHSHEHCHHHCYEKCSCTAKGKPRLTSDTCLCSSNLNDHAAHCNKDHVPCNHGCCTKGLKKISLVQEQKDEELDDCVGTIHHKDSLCILVEKYKANRKCKIKKCADEAEISDERIKDDKSFTSETTCQLEDINSKQREKHSDNKHRFRGKTCRHGCGQVIRDGDYNHIKNLKSRLIKTGTCCSPKGTPWRHTFYV